MLFMPLLLNFLVAGIAVASVVPAESNEVHAAKNAKREVNHGDDAKSVLLEFASGFKSEIGSKFDLIVESCKAGHDDVVKSVLDEISDKFAELKDHCHDEGDSSDPDEVQEFSHEFVGVLSKFQAAVVVIKSYPSIAGQCGPELPKCGDEVDEISNFITGHKVNFRALATSAGIDFGAGIGVGIGAGFKFGIDH